VTTALRGAPGGAPRADPSVSGFKYSEGWVVDSRLVILHARDAVNRGADVSARTRVVSA